MAAISQSMTACVAVRSALFSAEATDCVRPVPAKSATAASVSMRCAPFRGQALSMGARSQRIAVTRTVMAAEETDTKPAKKPVEEPKPFVPPTLDPNTPSPIFGGSTGGLLRKAQVEEFYVLTWEAKKEAIFEMPTGGAAIMRKGPNLLKLARKEQCLALLTQLRNNFKANGCIYRVYPSGAVEYLHPMDGVYPEKIGKNSERQQANTNMRSIGKNVNPSQIKFQGEGSNGMPLGPYEL
mmetsp:Transcript_19026/g.22758  ORF Transcript_19026/g.22758 Transcript_19026/m.22758 type:complete len:239 (-) Transcript_19026:255-971(-)|eukprot:CAMPEP_0197849576 /NCGR_PEP_ID=MMETSP1438-20131217/12644_1 /TAXON_ID=1461541 /ORGANISM="Pterosperma sp., Strain CCMP1384" /LENGTH=238 /DNA_ID=CAMNT_0043462337 /DNA_START=93 /DNA_END=809 /DNA_ORIENTATION=-